MSEGDGIIGVIVFYFYYMLMPYENLNILELQTHFQHKIWSFINAYNLPEEDVCMRLCGCEGYMIIQIKCMNEIQTIQK
jgi:hypothetical protein